MAQLAEGTGWVARRFVGEGTGYVAVLERACTRPNPLSEPIGRAVLDQVAGRLDHDSDRAIARGRAAKLERMCFTCLMSG